MLQDLLVTLIYCYTLHLFNTCVWTHASVCVARGGIYAIVPEFMITKPYSSRSSPKTRLSWNILWKILVFIENVTIGCLFLTFNVKQFLPNTVFVKVLL